MSESKGFLSQFGGPKGLFGGFVDEENGVLGYTPSFYALFIPAAFLALATALSPKGVAKKIFYWARGVTFFWVYGEKKGMKKAPDSAKITNVKPTRKTVIFIRHGESDWNEIFNKSKLLLLPRLVYGAIREILYLPTSHSVFIDSPLSKEGISQAVTLRTAISTHDKQAKSGGARDENLDTLVATLAGSEGGMPSILVSSNLRRAINTACIGLWNRIRKSKEKILLLSSLQEMSRNVDTNALAGPGEYPEMSIVQKTLGKTFSPAASLDPSVSTGNKGLFSRALPRMQKFNKFVFDRDEPCVIATGHSLYFKNYFNTFLPKNSQHESKTNKMLNCAAVSFEVVEGVVDGKPWYQVDESTITVIHGGFKNKKKKSK